MSSFKKRSADVLIEARAFHAPRRMTDEAIFNILSSIDTPRALTVWLLYSNKEHDQLTSVSIDPKMYLCRYRFRDDLAATSLLSKATFLKTSFKKEEVALAKFREYEELCRETNDRFRDLSSDPLYNGSNVSLLHAVTRKIEQVLGDFSPEEFVDYANWGPGVTTRLKGEHVSAINKFRDERGITHDLYSLVRDWFPVAYPSWHSSLSRSFGENYFVHEVGNEIVTVPKNSKTDRVIASEPGINLWFQKAIGDMIRRRLQRAGIDLKTQVTNQRFAKLGSLDPNSVATVDFSSASDSIAASVVMELLPPRWFALLEACRCSHGTLGSETLEWNKFSSMGNGFTFELESLIFYAAASAVVDHLGLPQDQISVFGDDVIIPTAAFELFSSFSRFLGFRVNPSKSYNDGSFRESCGAFYFDGLDCKPLFIKEKLNAIESLYKLANGIRLLAHRNGFNRYCDNRFLDCWSALVLGIPKPLRLRVPKDAGDTGLISNFDEAVPRRARNGVEGYHYRALVTTSVTMDCEDEAVILARLWQSPVETTLKFYPGLESRDTRCYQYHAMTYARSGRIKDRIMHRNSYALRGRSKRSVSDKALVQQWYNLGEWA